MATALRVGDLEPRLVGEIAGRFLVPSYQRGYRWGTDEVRRLLDDIHQSRGSDYFLQPVVVKERADNRWELVDGQQRLTTLYLILRYIRLHLPTARIGYSMEYETRAGSANYLEEPVEADSQRNIDFFHIFEAYRCIRAWFEDQPDPALAAIHFYASLSESVFVIWYEAAAATDSASLFTRLNVGRIPLTDAELVKALILSRSRGEVAGSDRALEIAAQWDGVERDLRTPEIWAFTTGRVDNEPTHISLLLDTLAGGPTGRERPLFHTFETLRPRIEADAQQVWDDVVDLHSLVVGWHNDRNLYHKIGYLIATLDSARRSDEFAALVGLSRTHTKSEFDAMLDRRIRRRLRLTSSDVKDLSYDSGKSTAVLLLMNVETVRTIRDSSERYSFKAHASRRWSLEHIHAQNAEQLNRAEQWTAWLRLHRAALAALPDLDASGRVALITRIDEAIGDITQDTFRRLQREIAELFTSSEVSDTGDLDSIANLVLLDSPTNSALSNSVFEVKRREIIERDRAGAYIPICTRNAFLKYYTAAEAQQIHFWGTADRSAYLEALIDMISPYLLEDATT